MNRTVTPRNSHPCGKTNDDQPIQHANRPNMNDNPYEPLNTDSVAPPRRLNLLVEVTKYGLAYLFGIVICVLVTPVDLSLGRVPIWPLYPLLAIIGVPLFYLYLSPQYLPFGSGYGYYFIKPFRSLWIGFPIGFLGTLGIYYTAAASI